MYAAIDLDTKLILDVALFGRRGTDPAAAFLHGLTEKHDLSEAEFLVDGAGYLTALHRLGLSGHLDYIDRNHIEKWFHPLKMRIDRFHNSWVGSLASAREWLEQFVHVLITAYLLFYNSISTEKSAINLALHAIIAIFCMSAILSSVFDFITCYWSYFWMVALFSVMSSPLVYGLVFKYKLC
ncbi:Integrase catalytic region [Natrialba taiwanensis DSM 12281]|uniref:Integrase catalytic region n=1 Tax=Natrialba taiwanensis DSM 12281 TaxID=1230458 RepID=M0A4P5_9EURY|nr:Integrase catalytic region [Natrialba taiwanensis DSM 12281]